MFFIHMYNLKQRKPYLSSVFTAPRPRLQESGSLIVSGNNDFKDTGVVIRVRRGLLQKWVKNLWKHKT